MSRHGFLGDSLGNVDKLHGVHKELYETNIVLKKITRTASRSTMTANGEQNLEHGNKEYAASFTQGHLALPPSQKYAICM